MARAIKIRKNKFVAIMLTICILFQTCVYSPTASAEDAGFTMAVGNGYVTLNGVNVEYDATLREATDKIGEGGLAEYILQVTMRSAYTSTKINQSTFVAENGTYPVSKDGLYLVELWGGDGASVNGAGVGGNGGHVYATVYLKAGQTIFFSLGGNGQPSNKTYEGGGANGSGGAHGIVGSYTVGGGGGYSALFLFDEGEFESSYGSLKAKNISETDRTSRYFMIAGGGGGGGAAASSGTVIGTADGGNGGNLESTTGRVSGSGLVAGTYFAGSNGKSTGTSASYVGRGGTNVPGAIADTILGVTDAKMTRPDNWFGTVAGIGGAGGSGELRGGGGGAGYAGGSGGVMTSVVIASNVGGGGGGSSFVASSLNEQDVNYSSISDAAKKYLSNENPSADGGAVCITYLGTTDISFLGNMNLEWCFSEYTVPMPGGLELTHNGQAVDYGKDGEMSESGITASHQVFDADHSHEKAILKGFSLLDQSGEVGGEFSVAIRFTYSEHFMGGNNLPIFNQHGTSYDAPMILTATYGNVAHSTTLDMGKDCGYVNMPLRIHVHAHTQEANAPSTPFLVNSMFYDEYALPCYDNDNNLLGPIRANLAKLNDPSHINSYQYSQIKAIGEYEVRDSGGNLLDTVNGVVTPNTTSEYRVSLDVQMIPDHETGFAAIGKRTETDDEGWVHLTGTAVIIVPGSRSEMLGKFMVHYSKTLKYENGMYVYTLNVNSQADQNHNISPDDEALNHLLTFDSANPVVEFDHTIEADGWYLIQLWGGNGGAGGGGMLGWSEGGKGGTGGYVSGYVKLNKGDIVELFYGINGSNDNSGSFVAGSGGKHSRASIITVDSEGNPHEEVIMIAGGGGGGGYGFISSGSNGGDATIFIEDGTLDSSSEYSAYDGAGGSNREGGAAGKNYRSSRVITDISQLGAEAQKKYNESVQEDYLASAYGGGAGFVKCLQIADTAKDDIIQGIGDALTRYGLVTEITKYFDVVGDIVYNNVSNTPTSTVTAGENNTAISISNIIPIVNTQEDSTTVYGSVDFDIVINLRPKDGFMGGNDVPVIVENKGVSLTHIQYEGSLENQVTESILLGPNDSADYANVKIAYTAPEVTGNKIFRTANDPATLKSELYTLVGSEPPVPVVGEEWKYDFVEVVNKVTDLTTGLEAEDNLTPEHTTEYEISKGIKSKADPVKASKDVVAPQIGSVNTDIAIIIVGHEVKFVLTDLTHNATELHGRYVAEQGNDYSVTITTIEGKLLPHDIEVRVGDNVLADTSANYGYNLTTGKITVKSAVITDDITITAVAHNETFTISYVYVETPSSTTYKTVENEFEAGVSISSGFHSTYDPEVEGYSFMWDWGDGSTTPPAEMPASDIWVVGSFVPNQYNLTVEYVYEDGREADSPHSEDIVYAGDYAISVPHIDGYLPYVEDVHTMTVSGTMGTSDVTVRVVYKATKNMLSITYRRLTATGEQIDENQLLEYATNEAYSIPIKAYEGYTQSRDGQASDAEWTTINGTMPQDGSSVAIIVYYIPNVYSVEFVVGEETVATRDVVFGNIYGFDPEGNYSVFYEPTKEHSEFEGWYLDETRIYEDTVVSTAGDHKLVAQWEDNEYSFTIKYVYENGEEAADSITFTGVVGDTFEDQASPTIDGHTPDKELVSVVIGEQDVIVTVTYKSKYSDAPYISHNVAWGNLNFDFEYGVWSPLTHAYANDVFTPQEAGNNIITVTNNEAYVYENGEKKNINIIANYSFEALDGCEEVIGIFTQDNSMSGTQLSSSEISNGAQAVVYFWLDGNFEPSAMGTHSVGTCTVTIRGGETEK